MLRISAIERQLNVEKRAHNRYAVWFPVTVKSGDRSVWAICHDASSGGILVLCSSPLEQNASVVVTFRVMPEEANERNVDGRVVRVDPIREEPRDVWTHRMAIEFCEPVGELQGVLHTRSSMPPSM